MAGLGLRTVGRAAKPVEAAYLRDLVPADLDALGEERGIKPQPLKRIATRHHALARALASGMPDGEAALMVGLTASRVSILKEDPAFRELLAFHQSDTDRIYADVHESLAAISYDAIELLRERIEEEPEKVTNGQLLEIAKMGADRTGHGPQSAVQTTNFNVNISERLAEARKRVAARRLG